MRCQWSWWHDAYVNQRLGPVRVRRSKYSFYYYVGHLGDVRLKHAKALSVNWICLIWSRGDDVGELGDIRCGACKGVDDLVCEPEVMSTNLMTLNLCEQCRGRCRRTGWRCMWTRSDICRRPAWCMWTRGDTIYYVGELGDVGCEPEVIYVGAAL